MSYTALAYRLVEQHGLIEGNAYSEAEFLLGYIALRYMNDPALAFDHFSRILTRVRRAQDRKSVV